MACDASCVPLTCVVGVHVATVQEGLDAASCATVWLPAGRYAGPFALPPRDVTLTGVGPESVLEGDGTSALFSFLGQQRNLTLTRLELTGGRAAQGGVLSGSGRLVVEDAIVSENHATVSGGAFHFTFVADAVFRRVSFVGNRVEAVELTANPGGGAIETEGAIEIVDCTFTDNEVVVTGPSLGHGGAVSLLSGSTATITGSLFEGNLVGATVEAEGDCTAAGGAVHAKGTDLTVTSTRFVDNTVHVAVAEGGSGSAEGGAVALDEVTLAATSVAFEGNRAAVLGDGFSRASGGAVFSDDSSIDLSGGSFRTNTVSAPGEAIGGALLPSNTGAVRLEGVTFEGNAVVSDGVAYGGAMAWTFQAPDSVAELRRCAFVDNEVRSNNSLALAGALRTSAGGWSLENCTFDGNRVGPSGGTPLATSFVASIGTVDLRNVTLGAGSAIGLGVATTDVLIQSGAQVRARNSLFAGSTFLVIGAAFVSEGYNVLTIPTTPFDPSLSTDVLGANASLGARTSAGSDTPYLPTMPGSPARDGGDPAGCPGIGDVLLTTDQRGAPRSDARCDVGAYEAQP